MARVLIACEFSGIVRDAFIARGHDAISCDLLPTERPGPHIQDDVLLHLEDGWDAMIAFPSCTYLCSSGLHWNKRRPEREQLTHEALLFVFSLMDAGREVVSIPRPLHHTIPKIALENPIGRINTAYRKPDQIIQPWQFGHDASKGTCLWLRGLPPLKPTCSLKRPVWVPCPDECDDYFCQRHLMHTADCPCPSLDVWVEKGDDPYYKYYANQTPSGQNKLGPSPTRAADRSRTYQGIADAMATQWSPIISLDTK